MDRANENYEDFLAFRLPPNADKVKLTYSKEQLSPIRNFTSKNKYDVIHRSIIGSG